MSDARSTRKEDNPQRVRVSVEPRGIPVQSNLPAVRYTAEHNVGRSHGRHDHDNASAGTGSSRSLNSHASHAGGGGGANNSSGRRRSRSRGRPSPGRTRTRTRTRSRDRSSSRSRREARGDRRVSTPSPTRGGGGTSLKALNVVEHGGHHVRRQSRGSNDSRSRLVPAGEDGEMSSIEDGHGGSIVSGFSLMRETPQRPERSRGRRPNRSRSNNRSSRSVSRGRNDRDWGTEGARRSESPDSLLIGAKQQHGRSSSRSVVRGDSVGANIGGTTQGYEPAVKSAGFITSMTFLKLMTFSAMAYCAVKLWTMHYESSTGRLCTFGDRNKCVTSASAKVLLTVSRMTAGGLFVTIACSILSKCYASRYFLHHSWLSLVVSFEPAHEFHTYFGWLTIVFGVIHSAAHLAREIVEGPGIHLDHRVNQSGVLGALLLFPIVLPMMMSSLKKLMRFEVRKALHMLFIPFVVAMCFHGKALRGMCVSLLVLYIVDRSYFTTRMSFFIERPSFRPVGRGTFLRFDLPPGYQFKVGAYIQVSCPAINATEWHPFSIFPVPGSRPRAGFHVEAVGDWTQELFRLSLENPSMPLWITAAQPSVLEKSMFFDNVMVVCTGAGITPAVCLADMYSKKKNVYLLWLSREAGMIAMFEKQLRRVKSTVHLTGKPSAKTKQRMIDLLAPSKKEVVTTTAARSHSRSSSLVDLGALEAGIASEFGRPHGGGGGTWRPPSYRGELRQDDDVEDDRASGGTEAATDDGLDDSIFGGGAHHERNGSYRHGGSRGRSSMGAVGDADEKRARGKRVPFGQPISLNFGRPDIEKFIAETIQGTAVEGTWAPTHGGDPEACPDTFPGGNGRMGDAPPPTIDEEAQAESGPPPKRRERLSRKVLARLSTNQRISKRDLMSADLSVIPGDPKGHSAPTAAHAVGGTSDNTPCPSTSTTRLADGRVPFGDPKTWLVLYCGANAKVEKAVATACDGMGVTWRKEYFSAW